MLRYVTSISIPSATILIGADLKTLDVCENVTSIVLIGANLINGASLKDLTLLSCERLTSLQLTNISDLQIPAPKTAMADPYAEIIPASWKDLAKLQSLNFADCGLKAEAVRDLVIALNARVIQGMGRYSQVANSHSLILNGQNATPLVTPEFTQAKANLATYGWAVVHN